MPRKLLSKAMALAGAIAAVALATPAASSSTPTVNSPLIAPGVTTPFAYGYDFGQVAPEQGVRWNNSDAVTAAESVMRSIPALQVQAIMGWGPGNPEPSPGVYDFKSLDRRVNLIAQTGGTGVIDLCGAPDWMKGGRPGDFVASKLLIPPTPAHYEDFAALAAKIAARYPQVKYFIVWKELQGFWNPTRPGPKRGQVGNWNIENYTTLYNDVYTAIKAVRPDAMIGGPYAPVISFARPITASTSDSPQGHWGAADQRVLDAISYWNTHKVGGDFVAVDGPAYTKDAGYISDPLVGTEKFRAIGQWLSTNTNLPIWWMESPLVPPGQSTGPSAAALRMAAFIRMREGGISAGLQWQPVNDATGAYQELGLVTDTRLPGGGQPTAVASLLPNILPVLQQSSPSEPYTQAAGVLVATGPGGTIALNTTSAPGVAKIGAQLVTLAPGQVEVWKLGTALTVTRP